MAATVGSGPTRSDFLVAAIVVGAGLFALPANGAGAMSEDQALEHGYGFGVHAFFAGDYQRAHDDLDQVIQTGIQDPRAWYFRGLAALKLGRLDEAEADFERGADIEATSAADWPVGRSLERIQGRQRLALERHRIRARIVLQQRQKEASDRRYADTMERQDEYQRRRRPQGASPGSASKFEAEGVDTPAGTDAVGPTDEGPASDSDGGPDATGDRADDT